MKPSLCSSMMKNIQVRKNDLYCLVWVLGLEFSSFVIANENRVQLLDLYQHGKQPQLSVNTIAGENMKSEYDFSKMNSRKNPYASKLKKQVTIRMGQDVISYFKAMSEDTGIPYQSLINLYLKDCVSNHRKINLSWAKQA